MLDVSFTGPMRAAHIMPNMCLIWDGAPQLVLGNTYVPVECKTRLLLSARAYRLDGVPAHITLSVAPEQYLTVVLATAYVSAEKINKDMYYTSFRKDIEEVVLADAPSYWTLAADMPILEGHSGTLWHTLYLSNAALTKYPLDEVCHLPDAPFACAKHDSPAASLTPQLRWTFDIYQAMWFPSRDAVATFLKRHIDYTDWPLDAVTSATRTVSIVNVGDRLSPLQKKWRLEREHGIYVNVSTREKVTP